MADRLSISVVIITRNRAAWLRETLDSLVRQSRSADEVVVVNNASADNTEEVILGFQGKLNIKYVYEAKRGIPQARNASLMAASGDIIATIDDDCVADVNWLKNIEIPFIKDPNIGAVGGEVSYLQVGETLLEDFYIENMISRQRKEE
jgi:glycosyltransferase involved in cell wall biosynthesis